MTPRVEASRSTKFRLGRKRYRVNADGMVAIALVNEILEAISNNRTLFTFRRQIRSLRHRNCRVVLCRVAAVTDEPQVRLIAIWLRGHCYGQTGTNSIAEFADNENERVRAAVARAMHRMSGWGVLHRMQNDESPRVRRIAAPRSVRAFSDRLRAFSNSVEQIVTPVDRSKEMYVAPNLQLQKPITLRTSEMIRAVLERIRALVAPSRLN